MQLINVLLHLSDPNIDKNHLTLIVDGLSIVTNIDSYASLEMLCRIYAQFTHPNYIKINQNVIDYIVKSTTHYNKYDFNIIDTSLKISTFENQQQLKNQQNGLILTVNHCTMGVELKNANEETDSDLVNNNVVTMNNNLHHDQ
eukprot:199631_1